MHDIDRTLDEMNYSNDYQEFNEYEDEFESELEFEDEFEFEDEHEFEDEFEYDDFDEEYESELELAAELLSMESESELDYFFGKLFRKAKKFVRSKRGRALTRMLKNKFKKVLPMAGTAVGTFFGGPAGGAVGNRAASILGNFFEFELEGMSPEDQELEASKALIKVAKDAARLARQIPGGIQAQKAAAMAFSKAAKKHAPGLLNSGARRPNRASGCSCGRATGKKGVWRMVVDRKGRKKLVIHV